MSEPRGRWVWFCVTTCEAMDAGKSIPRIRFYGWRYLKRSLQAVLCPSKHSTLEEIMSALSSVTSEGAQLLRLLRSGLSSLLP